VIVNPASFTLMALKSNLMSGLIDTPTERHALALMIAR
jgi:hypothetical protein